MKKSLLINGAPRRLMLDAETAVDLMTTHARAIPDTMWVREAAAFLTRNGISAAPVVDATGRPVGVLSRADIVRYDAEKAEEVADLPEQAGQDRLVTQWWEALPGEGHATKVDGTPVREIMTPVVFSVAPKTPADAVVDAMLTLGVHRLFVTGGKEELVGVISALDVLRHLCRERPDAPGLDELPAQPAAGHR
jgi:CBS domain-containing protein